MGRAAPERSLVEVFHDGVREVVESSIAQDGPPEMNVTRILEARVRMGRTIAEIGDLSGAEVSSRRASSTGAGL